MDHKKKHIFFKECINTMYSLYVHKSIKGYCFFYNILSGHFMDKLIYNSFCFVI